MKLSIWTKVYLIMWIPIGIAVVYFDLTFGDGTGIVTYLMGVYVVLCTSYLTKKLFTKNV